MTDLTQLVQLETGTTKRAFVWVSLSSVPMEGPSLLVKTRWNWQTGLASLFSSTTFKAWMSSKFEARTLQRTSLSRSHNARFRAQSYEEYDLFEQVKATAWLIPFTRQLRVKLAREKGYYLSHAREWLHKFASLLMFERSSFSLLDLHSHCASFQHQSLPSKLHLAE